jgi:hypothetical protein
VPNSVTSQEPNSVTSQEPNSVTSQATKPTPVVQNKKPLTAEELKKYQQEQAEESRRIIAQKTNETRKTSLTSESLDSKHNEENYMFELYAMEQEMEQKAVNNVIEIHDDALSSNLAADASQTPFVLQSEPHMVQLTGTQIANNVQNLIINAENIRKARSSTNGTDAESAKKRENYDATAKSLTKWYTYLGKQAAEKKWISVNTPVMSVPADIAYYLGM